VCPAGDADCDGVPDAQDNCPFVANADQKDSDRSKPNAKATGVTAAWAFDEGSGTLASEATAHYNGTLVGAPSWVTGFSGKALDFRSSAGVYVSETTLAGPSAPFSLETKVNLRTVQGNLMRWGNLGPLWQLSFGGQTVPFGSTAGSIPTGRWVHLAYTFDGTTSRYYQDGQLVAAFAERPWSSGEKPLKIGEGVDGVMDEVAVFPRVLSAAELQQHTGSLFGDGLGDACDPCPNNSDASCVPPTCVDTDGDGYGVAGASACSAGQPDKFDCDDGNAGIHPGGLMDVCDGKDNDCDGIVDEDCPTGAAATTYSYDGNGNQVHKVGPGVDTEYVFDARDRLVEVKEGGSSVARYGYDTQNLRVYMKDAGGERRVLLDGVEEMGEYEVGALGRVARYDHDASHVDGLLAQVAGGKTEAVTDALGSVYGLTDASAAVEARYSYDVYGIRTVATEAVPTAWGFTGRRHENSWGAIYSRARHLAPREGRWLAPDPFTISNISSGGLPASPMIRTLGVGVGRMDELARYRYAFDNAPLLTDPSGLVVFSLSAVGSAGIGGFAGPVVGASLNSYVGISSGGVSSALGYTIFGGLFGGIFMTGTLAEEFGFYWGYTTACSAEGDSYLAAADFLVAGVGLVFRARGEGVGGLPGVGAPIGITLSAGFVSIPIPSVQFLLGKTTLKYRQMCCNK
jgi:RHS repeat-associated protein